jgi:hypothetical protein
VERNVIFNENDVQISDESVSISSGALSEGEMEGRKIIQSTTNSAEDPNKSREDDDQPEKEKLDEQEDSNPENTIPFPTEPDITDKDTPDEDQQIYGRGRRQRKPQGAYREMEESLDALVTYFEDPDDENQPFGSQEEHDCIKYESVLVATHPSDPKTLDEGLRGPDGKHWEKALQYEISQLEKLGTWTVEDLPAGQTAIPCSEVIRVKRGPDAKVQSYRVRIVAGGHRQVEGINYTETFSAAAKMPTVRAVLANAAHQNWEIEHVDVKSAYLNAKLEETIYMKAPRGVLKPGQEGKVLRLKKGLYGLKQAGRGWYLEMSRVFLKELGFTRSAIDHSVFYKHDSTSHVIVAVATDDMAVTSKRAVDAEKFKSDIRRFWEITDNGPIKWFLGFEIKRDRDARTIAINQRAYIENIVEKFRLTGAKPVHNPMEPGSQYSIDQCPSSLNQMAKMRGIPYSEAIGSVLWPVVVSRPDAAFAVGVLSQFIQNPGLAHWEGVKRVISYLGTTKNLWLTFGGSKESLVEGFCDADWAGQKHRHSISGYSFHYGVGAVSWSSKKQNIVALSSTEAEYVAQTHAAKEGIWLRSFISEIQGTKHGPLTISCDNQGAIALAKDNKYHARTKHIDLRYHFIREAVEDGKIKVRYIPTEENTSDIFTKPLPKPKFQYFVEKLGLKELKEDGHRLGQPVDDGQEKGNAASTG